MLAPLLSFRLVVVAALLCVLGGVGSAVAVRDLSRTQSVDNAHDDALAAARQIAVDLTAYDYRHVAADFKRVEDESIGTFHAQFLTQSTGVAPLIVKAKAVSNAEVAGAGLTSVAGDRATAVLALNRTVKNTGNSAGRTDSFAMRMQLQLVRGRWLASAVTFL
jgi:Mce-associated membrane protein